jgi:hypothetical protein
MTSTITTVTPAAIISKFDLAPVEVEITEAKKNPINKLIKIKDDRRQD